MIIITYVRVVCVHFFPRLFFTCYCFFYYYVSSICFVFSFSPFFFSSFSGNGQLLKLAIVMYLSSTWLICTSLKKIEASPLQSSPASPPERKHVFFCCFLFSKIIILNNVQLENVILIGCSDGFVGIGHNFVND